LPRRCAPRNDGSWIESLAIHENRVKKILRGGGPALGTHGAFPRNAAQLKELGVGYTDCAPTPEARLLKSLSDQAAEARKQLG
jgi:hypothetical protein